MSSTLSRSKNSKKFILTCPKIITWTPLSLRTAYASTKSTKMSFSETNRYKALQNLTRACFYAVQNLVQEKQRVLNVPFKKNSSMTQEKVFSDTFRTTVLTAYEKFDSTETLACMNLRTLSSEKERTDSLIWIP